MKSNQQNNFDVNKILKNENEDLKTRLSINKKIIQEFFKNRPINEKTSAIVENIKKENNVLLSKIENLKKENEKLSKICSKLMPNQKNNTIELYENKLFVYENLLREKQSIIVNLKDQNKNLKQLLVEKFDKEKIKEMEKNIIKEKEINDINKSDINNKYIIEEIYITSPHKLVNTLNDKIEFYKSVNIKLKNIIKILKMNLTEKEKDYFKLEDEALKAKQELQKFTQMKNNEQIINQLIQYQSMKSIPVSQSCSNLKIQSNEFNNKNNINNLNKTKNHKSSSYIMTKSSNLKDEKIMKEIERYENINKKVKEITDNDFDLAGEWAETLKHCGMTQEEFLRFCGMKIANKLTNAIEYLYKILIDKNIQIKLLTKENEALNEENIRLNKINIEMELFIRKHQKNKNNINHKSKSVNKENSKKNIYLENKKRIKNNTFFKDYKNKFLNESNNNKFNNDTSQNELQSTFVNVDNNITHTNININMMMDYDKLNNLNKNSVTSSEFKEGLLLNDINQIIKRKNINDNINKQENNNLFDSKKYFKNNDNTLKYLKLNKRKINNNSYNKLIKDRKNENNDKTQSVSMIKKSCKNFYNFDEYNRTIKNIFSNTEKIQIKNAKKNITPNFKINQNKKRKIKINNINLNTDTIINNLKLIKNNKILKNEKMNNQYKFCRSENNGLIKISNKIQ